MSRTISRRSGAVAAIACAAIALSACSSADPAPADSDSAAEPSVEGEPITVTDELGREVTLDGPAQTAVSINSYNSDLVIALAGKDSIVGTDENTIVRASYAQLDPGLSLGPDYNTLDYEALIALDPDVILFERNGVWEETEAALEGFDIPIVVASVWDPAQWETNVELYGQIFGAQERAEEILDFTAEVKDLVAERVDGLPEVTVYYEDGAANKTAGANSGKTQFIRAAGGRSIFDDVTANSGLNFETDPAEIILANPDFVIHETSASYDGTPAAELQSAHSELTQRAGWEQLTAVQEGNIVVYNAWPLNLAGWTLAQLYVGSWIHPEAFADIDPNDYASRWATEFLGAEFDDPSRFAYAGE